MGGPGPRAPSYVHIARSFFDSTFEAKNTA